jgi:hypothetical protein
MDDALTADLRAFATHSPITDPGPFAALLDSVPGDLRSLAAAARRLVFHYRGDGDWASQGIAPERISEIDTRHAEPMLRRLVALHDAPLTAERAPHQRLVGCCRDFTVLFLTLARHHGVPARARVGFATYFIPSWQLDHEIAEVWDAGERRWRLVDAELHDGHRDRNDDAILDPLDLPPDRFIVAPRAWLACRTGEADPARFVVHPDLDIPGTQGWPYLRHNLVHDLAALNKREMILWDDWGLAEIKEPDAGQLALLDHTATALLDPDLALTTLRALYERDEFRVPAEVTSHSPAADRPLRVALPDLA